MTTFAEKVISFNSKLSFEGQLPDGIRIMNPFMESPEAVEISSLFYKKYYSDTNDRKLILGINPGRHGAGLIGVPFTDTKRLADICAIDPGLINSHEPSSVFVYDMIEQYGGAEKFYGDYFINSVCPLGFVRTNEKGNEINYNYYDSRQLTETVEPFIVKSLQDICSMGIYTGKVWCLGTGKNYKYLTALNSRHKLFDTIIPLEHPRYIMQYRSKQISFYIGKYLDALSPNLTII